MEFKRGDTIYHVHAFPFDGKFWIDKCTVLITGTKFEKTGSPSMVIRKEGRKGSNEISLRDSNVIPNIYNSHRIFKTEDEAIEYCADASQWRPLGFTAEEWEESRKAEYLADKAYNSMMDDLYEEF